MCPLPIKATWAGDGMANNPAAEGTRRAIIHVGPHKTGSTFIQQTILNEQLLLETDRVAVVQPEDAPGHFGNLPTNREKATANVAHSLRSSNIVPFVGKNIFSLRRFMEFMKQSIENKMDILFSAEDFSDTGVSLPALSWMLTPWDHVTVVMVYRRYFEWIHSIYFELYRPEESYQNRYQASMPSFVEMLRKSVRDQKSLKHPLQISQVMERYKSYFHDFIIVNYHDKITPLQVNFFCSLHLENTCKELFERSQNATVERSTNKQFALEYMRLIQIGIEKNVIRKGCDVVRAALKMEQHMGKNNRTWRDLPLDCLEDSMVEELYEITVEEEKEMVPGWYQEEGRYTIGVAFEKFRASKALCAVDAEIVFGDENWDDFFRSL